MAKSISVYSALSISGAGATKYRPVEVDIQAHQDVADSFGLLEVREVQGLGNTPTSPGAAVDIVLKVAVTDTELTVASAPSILANAVAVTLTCRLANDATSTLIWRSGVFAINGRFVYVWIDKDALATNAVIALTVDLKVNSSFAKLLQQPIDVSGAVISVAGRDGDVVLVAADVTDLGTAAVEDVEAFVAADAVGTAAAEDVDAFTAAPVAVPASAAASGVAGTWAYDATNIYVCIATNTWVKATLGTWE